MALFATVLHIYKSTQIEVLNKLSDELKNTRGLARIEIVAIDNANFEKEVTERVYKENGVFYLVSPLIGHWITVKEINVKIENPFYLYDLTNSLSKKLGTFALSFHLHDGGVLFYNLEQNGKPIDGYSSDLQFFLDEPMSKKEVIEQRHAPKPFAEFLPVSKTTEQLNALLNEGYWAAFDNNDLDEDGCPNDDKYFIDEEDRLKRIGKYLEIYNNEKYPFSDNINELKSLNLTGYSLFKAQNNF